MVNINAQEWLDEKYPKGGVCQRDSDKDNKGKRREEITKLEISKEKLGSNYFNGNKNLIGILKLEKFINLRTLIVSSHELISLDVSECPNLEELNCHGNQLTSLNVNNCRYLSKINCSDNNIRELEIILQ